MPFPPSRPCSFPTTDGTFFGMHSVYILPQHRDTRAYHFYGKAKIRAIYSAKLCSLLLGLPTTIPERSAIRHFSSDAGVQDPIFYWAPPIHSCLSPMAGPSCAIFSRLVLVFYVPVAIVTARCYRWCLRARNSFSFRARTGDFLKLYFREWFFTLLTLGT